MMTEVIGTANANANVNAIASVNGIVIVKGPETETGIAIGTVAITGAGVDLAAHMVNFRDGTVNEIATMITADVTVP